MTLRAKEYKKVLEVIETIYSVPDKTAMFNAVCDELQRMIGFYSAVIMPFDRATQRLVAPGSVIVNTPLEFVTLFINEYSMKNPFLRQNFMQKVVNDANRISEVISPSELKASEYHQGYQALFDLFHEMGIQLSSQGDTVAGMGLHRQTGDPDFSDRDIEIMKILAPHFARAFHIFDLVHGKAEPPKTGGLVMVDNTGKATYMNEEARSALQGRPPGVIPIPAIGSPPVYFQGANGRTYRVRTIPLGSECRGLSILLEPLPPEEGIQSRLNGFGLTKRETETAVMAIQGYSNREIAQRLFITEQTVKDHLQNVFEKVRVKSRCELAARAYGLCREAED